MLHGSVMTTPESSVPVQHFRSPAEVARALGGQPVQERYASSLAALLAHHDVRPSYHLVPSDPGPTFVMDVGEGEPVVFVHGTPATSAVWVPLLEHLHGIRALVVDRPSHGLSGDFEFGDVPAAEIRAHGVRYLESLLDGFGLGSATFVCSSYGGLWAMWLASDRPDRVGRLVLAGGPPGMRNPKVPLIFGLLSVPWIAWVLNRIGPPSPRSTRRFFRQWGDPVDQLSPAMVEAYTDSQRLPATASLMRNIQRAARFPGRFDHRSLWLDDADLGRIATPTLFLWGPNDFVGDVDHAHATVAAMPNAELEIVGVGHLPWLQDPATCARSIERVVSM